MKSLLFGAAFLCLVTSGCSRDAASSDVQFAQTSFTSLARGDSSAEALIDFEVLKVATIDAGAQYVAMPDETQKAGFRRAFVSGFSSSFQASGASVDNFKNWHSTSSDSARTVVVADGPKGIASFTISHRDNQQKISVIDVVSKKP